MLVGKPEAAALYYKTIVNEYNLVADQKFLTICDAGRGTVDLVLYRVNVDKNNENTLTEEVASDSSMWGSENLDINYTF